MAYFAAWSVSQLVMSPIAAWFVWRHQRRYTRRGRSVANYLARQPLVSVIVPACNEELTVVDSVRALLAWNTSAVKSSSSTTDHPTAP
jgi:hypothetical protein